MDPEQTLRDLKEAVVRSERGRARELRRALRDWVDRGGFEPADPNWRNY